MPEDKINFAQFLKELRYSFDAEVSTLNREDRLLLSVAVSASERFINVCKYFEFSLTTRVDDMCLVYCLD